MIGNIPLPLSNEEIILLFKEYQNGSEKAREKIINHNIRLVDYVVNKYFTTVSLDKDDLEGTGLIGLIKAVDSFDVDKNITFATFATRVICNEILMLLRKTKGKNMASLDDIISTDKDGGELTLGDTLYDEKYNFVEKIDNEETLKMVRDYVLNMPDSKEKRCIILYFGFNCNALNQPQIANILGISQSYVTRIINKTVKKIGNELVDIGAINKGERIKDNETISLDKLPSDRYNVGQIFKDNESFNIIKEFVLNMPNSREKQAIIMYYGFKDKSYDKRSIAKFLRMAKYSFIDN